MYQPVAESGSLRHPIAKYLVAPLLACFTLGPLALPGAAQSEAEVEVFRAAYGRYQEAIEVNDLEAAEPAAAEALEAGKKVLAADSPSLLALHVNHGDLLVDLGRPEEAVELLGSAIRQFERRWSPGDGRLVYARWAMAEATGSTGRHERAVKQLQRIAGTIEAAHGPQSRVVADLQLLLGQQSYLSDKYYEKARLPLERALAIYKAQFGYNVYQTGLIALWLGKAELLEESREAAAEAHFLEALRVFEATTPPGHALRHAAHDLLVQFYEERGESGSATAHLLAMARMSPRQTIDGEAPQYRKPADYPETAARQKNEGWVRIEFTVGADGTVATPRVIDSDGGPDFVTAALEAVAGYRYVPAVREGQPVVSPGVRAVVNFRLADLKARRAGRTARRQAPRTSGTGY